MLAACSVEPAETQAGLDPSAPQSIIIRPNGPDSVAVFGHEERAMQVLSAPQLATLLRHTTAQVRIAIPLPDTVAGQLPTKTISTSASAATAAQVAKPWRLEWHGTPLQAGSEAHDFPAQVLETALDRDSSFRNGTLPGIKNELELRTSGSHSTTQVAIAFTGTTAVSLFNAVARQPELSHLDVREIQIKPGQTGLHLIAPISDITPLLHALDTDQAVTGTTSWDGELRIQPEVPTNGGSPKFRILYED